MHCASSISNNSSSASSISKNSSSGSSVSNSASSGSSVSNSASNASSASFQSFHAQAKYLRKQNNLKVEESFYSKHFKNAYQKFMSENEKEEDFYELLHFKLDFTKYLVRKAKINTREITSIEQFANLGFYLDFTPWIHKIARLFAYPLDKDIRRRALEIGFHILILLPYLENEKNTMFDIFEKGLMEYIDLIVTTTPHSLDVWWEKRKRSPFSEFMLGHDEIHSDA